MLIQTNPEILATNMENISEKELAMKKMGLNPWQDGVIKLAVSNKEKRKQLWDMWRTKHPESKKTWRTDRAQGPDTLRCQAQVTIKKISATIANPRDGPDEPASLERSSSIRSEISDIDTHIPPAEVKRIQEEVQEMRDRESGEIGSNPILNNQEETQEAIILSEIYIDDRNLTKWQKTTS